jgi:hypothetical protein
VTRGHWLPAACHLRSLANCLLSEAVRRPKCFVCKCAFSAKRRPAAFLTASSDLAPETVAVAAICTVCSILTPETIEAAAMVRCARISRRAVTSRTAVYGPVRTVWEGRSREAPRYPDLWPDPEATLAGWRVRLLGRSCRPSASSAEAHSGTSHASIELHSAAEIDAWCLGPGWRPSLRQ